MIVFLVDGKSFWKLELVHGWRADSNSVEKRPLRPCAKPIRPSVPAILCWMVQIAGPSRCNGRDTFFTVAPSLSNAYVASRTVLLTEGSTKRCSNPSIRIPIFTPAIELCNDFEYVVDPCTGAPSVRSS